MTNAPPDLGEAGKALWDDMHTLIAQDDHKFDEKDVTLLTLACRQMDDVLVLQEALKSEGVITVGSTGQPVLSGIVRELRNQRESVARLLKQINWPGDVKLTPQQIARKAAAARWAGHGARQRTRVLPEAK